MITISEFRKTVKNTYPHVKVAVKTTSFCDLARGSAKCLSIAGERNIDELRVINDLAHQAGILPDSNVRFYR
jgi:hypothetical protein